MSLLHRRRESVETFYGILAVNWIHQPTPHPSRGGERPLLRSPPGRSQGWVRWGRFRECLFIFVTHWEKALIFRLPYSLLTYPHRHD